MGAQFSKPKITLQFADLDPCYPMKEQKEFFIKILSRNFDVVVIDENSNEEPEILIYSWWGSNNYKWQDCIRIYYTIEMDYPDFNLCDYAIGLSEVKLEDRFFHLPVYVIYDNLLKKYENKEPIKLEKEFFYRKFCSTLISNGNFRDSIYYELLDFLNNYKKVYSGGKFNNNIGEIIDNKIKFLNQFKFNLAIENSNFEGYNTEKLIEAFIADTIPIYWGAKSIEKEFGSSGYINVSNFKNIKEAVNYIIEVNENCEKYLDILNNKPILNLNLEDWENKLSDFLVNAIKKGKRTNYKLMMSKMYYERLTFIRLRDSYLGRIYRKFKSK